LATEAAHAVLRAGGRAMDAAIAAQLMLGVVEPQSSGLGGGAFLLHVRDGRVTAMDGRETAPAAAQPDRFLHPDGRPKTLTEALQRAQAVGVPGLVALLAEGHARWGNRPWAELVAPAQRTASEGFPISPRLHTLVQRDALLAASPTAAATFIDAKGQPYPVGHVLRQPDLAATLQRLANAGPSDFYQGALGRQLVQGLQAAGSDLSLADWVGYRVRVQPALCLSHPPRQICSAPPPAGGQTVLQGLGLWLATAPHRTPTPLRWHRWLEAQRLAAADRARYAADRETQPVPPEQLLAPDYLRQRAALIHDQALPTVTPGLPLMAQHWSDDPRQGLTGTTQLIVADRWGDWVLITASIEWAFGSRLRVQGVLMNNQLTDFSFLPTQDGQPVANRVQAGQRPRSAMAPLVVLSHGQVQLAVGSAGGSRILGYVGQPLASWWLGERRAPALLAQPHLQPRLGLIEHEAHLPGDWVADLTARGHRLQVATLTSGTQLVLRHEGQLWGAVDPRREGLARGD